METTRGRKKNYGNKSKAKNKKEKWIVWTQEYFDVVCLTRTAVRAYSRNKNISALSFRFESLATEKTETVWSDVRWELIKNKAGCFPRKTKSIWTPQGTKVYRNRRVQIIKL